MILEEIAQKTAVRIAEQQKSIPLEVVKSRAEEIAASQLKAEGKFTCPFESALKAKGMSYICEVKKASPSKGIIAQDFPYLDIAKEYEEAGAAALSVLTEPYYFKGSDEYLKQIASAVKIPVLRKDFTISPYMVYQAKVMGASAVLLICAILSDEQLKDYLAICVKLGLSAIVEAHTADEVKRAVNAGARIVGVNNRDLRTFNVDITTAVKLRGLVPEDIVYISESGIKTAQDVAILKQNNVDGVLIGETLMRSPDKKAALKQLDGVR